MKKNSIVKKLIITFSSITGGLLIIVGLVLSIWFYKFSHNELLDTLNKQLDVVSEALGSSRQNVKQLALKLLDKGLIKMEKDSNDARILRLRVCPKCYEYFREKIVYQEHFLELLYKDILEEEIQVTARCLQRLLENIIKIMIEF